MKKITADKLEKKFDDGEEMEEYIDFSKAKNFGAFLKERSECEDVHIYFPKKLIKKLDAKVKEIGVDRESFIKMVMAERLNILESPIA